MLALCARLYFDMDAYRSRDVSTPSGPVDVDVLALLVCLVGVLGLDPEGVRAEVVTLCLQQVGREVLGAVTVVEAQSGAESGSGDTPEGTLGNNTGRRLALRVLVMDKYLLSPSGLGLVNGLAEEFVEKQVLKLGVLAVRAGDLLQENGADDAATTPHEGNLGLVELPLVLLGGLG